MSQEIHDNATTLVNALQHYELELQSSWWHPDQYSPKWSLIADLHVPGFEFLGMGASRAAFLKDGLVYKIEYVHTHPQGPHIDSFGDRFYCNKREFSVYCEWMDQELPFGWKIPATDLVWVDEVPVIVMEFIEGKPLDDNDWDMCDEFTDKSGIDDMGYDNCMRTESGVIYVVDFAA